MSDKHIIDCDRDPFVPEGYKVVEHRKQGKLVWNPDRIEFYYLNEVGCDSINGHELRKRLENESVINACVLDYLLVHNEIIPTRWKKRMIFFWGTIYCDRNDSLQVCCLKWCEEKWDWDSLWLDWNWNIYTRQIALSY